MKKKLLFATATSLITSSVAFAQMQPPQPPTQGVGHVHYGKAVVASPFIGLRSAYDASDLITNYPSINTDLKILKQRKFLPSSSDSPLIELSGDATGQVLAHQQNVKAYNTDIDLTGAELEVIGKAGPFATAYLHLVYDKKKSIYPTRVSNSNVRVKTAFLTIGNLNKSNYYSTLGQIYVPFGAFSTSSSMVTDTIAKAMARTMARAVTLNYYQDGLLASVYGFKGTFQDNSGTGINNGGANLDYNVTSQQFSFDVGGSYIYNLAGSNGIGAVLNPNINLRRSVPAYDVRGKVGYNVGDDNISLLAEYVSVFRAFNKNDLSYRGKDAHVGALDIGLIYKFKIIGDKPAKIDLGYSHSWEAAGMSNFANNMLFPKNSYMATLTASLWKNTTEAIEYRHDVNYSRAAYMTSSASTPVTLASYCNLKHYKKSNNLITFQIEVYF